jgi:sugar phosphate isomerase/epimerase
VNSNDITRREALVMAGSAAVAALLPNGPSDAASEAAAAASGAKSARPALAIFSRHLHWAGMEEAVEVAASAGFGGIAWTIRNGAHVTPENVARELPRAVELTHRAGLGTPLIVTAFRDAESPHAESILETATGLGIHVYRAQSTPYDYSGDVPAQLEALRPKVASLARLNERYGATALFHTHSGEIGGALWDLLLLLRDTDPDRVAINFDTGYGMVSTGSTWREAVRFARSRIRSLSLKDFRWRQVEQAGRRRWIAEICQPGQGMSDMREMLSYFQSTGFHGPAEVQFEYPFGMPGGAAPINLMAGDGSGDVGRWKLQMPKSDFVALMKRDVDYLAGLLRETGLTPASGITPSADNGA